VIAHHLSDARRWTGILSADATPGEAARATLSSGQSATVAGEAERDGGEHLAPIGAAGRPPLTLPSPRRGEGELGS